MKLIKQEKGIHIGSKKRLIEIKDLSEVKSLRLKENEELTYKYECCVNIADNKIENNNCLHW